MSKILCVQKVGHVNDFAHAMVLLGKPLLKHNQMKSRNTEKNCTMEQRCHSLKKLVQTRALP